MLWKEPRYAWILLGYLWVIGFVSSIGRFLIAYYQPELSEAFHMTRSWIGFAWSANLLLGAIASIIGGWMMDRYGVKLVMMISSVLMVGGTLIILYATNGIGFFLGYGVVFGLAGISGSTANYVLTLQWFSYHRAKAILLLQSSGSIGIAILTPLFVQYQTLLDWKIGYASMLTFGFLTIFTTYFIIRENRPPSDKEIQPKSMPSERVPIRQRWHQLRAYASNPIIIVVWLALFSCGFHMGTVEMNLMAIHQSTHVHETMMATSLSVLGILEIGGALVFAFLLDRYHRIRLLALLYGIRCLAFLFLFLQWQASPLLFSILFGVTYLSAVPGAMLVAGEALSASYRSVALNTSLFILFHQLGGMLSGMIGGAVFDVFHSYQPLVLINLGLAGVTCVGYFLLDKRAAVSSLQKEMNP
ncbi:hypothetical protein BVG16_20895 [Paenibacillus selenitireducens]|uniref:Major facilitator superfamily (MFS) profile domain-containing protein n=1 Tax=Paenibacillus selenitireducens TaxID=1324314 RepID=A0A1T2X7H4_9BACL|nr:MFS transporter [Paenibacillus selenitireducens]OPA75827.1 hypothetical protein BVG16_20895 [Paenibacillus selenitireducens]